MIGLVIIAHGTLAQSLMDAARLVIGRTIEAIRAINIESVPVPEELNGLVADALEEVDQGDGVMIMTDMLGGSPDMSLSFLDPDRIEVLTGVNLPMVLEALTARRGAEDLKSLAVRVEKRTLESIYLAGRELG